MNINTYICDTINKIMFGANIGWSFYLKSREMQPPNYPDRPIYICNGLKTYGYETDICTYVFLLYTISITWSQKWWDESWGKRFLIFELYENHRCSYDTTRIYSIQYIISAVIHLAITLCSREIMRQICIIACIRIHFCQILSVIKYITNVKQSISFKWDKIQSPNFCLNQ